MKKKMKLKNVQISDIAVQQLAQRETPQYFTQETCNHCVENEGEGRSVLICPDAGGKFDGGSFGVC